MPRRKKQPVVAPPPPPRRRLEDRAPAVSTVHLDATRRRGEIPAEPRVPPALFGAAAGPAVSIAVREGVMHVEADVPGMDAGDVAVTVDRDSLTLRGVHCRFGVFEYVLQLPAAVQATARRIAVQRSQLKIDLPLEDGVRPEP